MLEQSHGRSCGGCGTFLPDFVDGRPQAYAAGCPVCFLPLEPVSLERVEEDPDFRPYLWDLED